MNIPNAGNVTNLPDGAVVEIMGTVDGAGVRGRDRTTVPGVMGEWLRRVHASQELTVEAALTGDRTLALEAMLLDPLCGALAYDDVVAMTDELITATAPLAAAVRVVPRSDSNRGEQMPPRIVVIGGGSFQWVPKLFCDLVNTPSLAEAEIVLEDIAPEPLADMTEFAQSIVDARGNRR